MRTSTLSIVTAEVQKRIESAIGMNITNIQIQISEESCNIMYADVRIRIHYNALDKASKEVSE
jgi:hypothetical protein